MHYDKYTNRKTTTRDLWETPGYVIDALSEIMGSRPVIDLAANAGNAKADEFIEDCDGGGLLALDPSEVAGRFGQNGWAFCNPPYSRGNLPAFTAWCADYARAGGAVIMLIPHAHGTRYWQENVRPVERAWFIPSRRVKFDPPGGVGTVRAPGEVVAVLMHTRDCAPLYVRYFDVI